MLDILTDELARLPLATSALVGGLCSYLGLHVVLRRIVFVSAALAEISALGVAVAGLYDWTQHGIEETVGVQACALVMTLLGVLLFSFKVGRGRVPEDGYIGIGYVVAWAGTLLLIYAQPHGEEHMHRLLQGDVLGVTAHDVQLLAVVFGVLALLHVLFFKEFVMVSFDPEMAQTLGVRVKIVNFLFYLSLGIAISLAIKDAGLLLVFSFLVLPPITGLLMSSRKEGVVIWSLAAALLASLAGVYASFTIEQISTGPAIVMCSFALFLVAWVKSRMFKD